MLTSLKLSNISYNTDKFLQNQLNDLLKSKKISFWYYIHHKAEEKEKKNHIHLFMIPDTRLDTTVLDDMFLEPVHDNVKPLRCKLWTKVISVPDNILYNLHDRIYCKLKFGEEKKYSYNISDCICSDQDIMDDLIYKSYYEFDFWKGIKFQQLLDNGLSPTDIVRSGYVNMNEMCNFHHMAQMLGGG